MTFLDSATVTFDQICYSYTPAEPTIHQVSFAVKSGELVVLVGPSGCGKSTLLKLVAGLMTPSQGRLLIDDVDVLSVPPQKRSVGWVPQSYALFDHLTVAENVAFGLRMQGMPAAKRKRHTQTTLELCRIADLATRAVSDLSGGQRQRVAIARALAIRPRVLLLDEPLAALDPQLRVMLRTNLARLLRESNVTTLFVTHDQSEALAIADRIAVLRAGQIEQYGTPETLWNHPANNFVATFLGDAQVVPGRRISENQVEIVPDLVVTVDPARLRQAIVQVAIRPDEVEVSASGIRSVVMASVYGGGRYLIHVQIPDGPALSLFSEQLLAVGTTISIRLRANSKIAILES